MRRFRDLFHKQGSQLPPELVEAIKDLSCVFRSHMTDESGYRFTRPLTMNFLGGPIYLDDEGAVTRRLQRHFPELTERQKYRVQSMIRSRIKRIHEQKMDLDKLTRSEKPDGSRIVERAMRRMDLW